MVMVWFSFLMLLQLLAWLEAGRSFEVLWPLTVPLLLSILLPPTLLVYLPPALPLPSDGVLAQVPQGRPLRVMLAPAPGSLEGQAGMWG